MDTRCPPTLGIFLVFAAGLVLEPFIRAGIEAVLRFCAPDAETPPHAHRRFHRVKGTR